MIEETPKIRMIVRRPVQPAQTVVTARTPDPEIAPVDASDLVTDKLPSQQWTDEALEYRETKKAISLRVDRDVLEYFQGAGKGYQTRMNAVLRAYMKAQGNQ